MKTTRRATLKKVSGKVSLEDWIIAELDAVKSFTELITKTTEEAIRIALEDQEHTLIRFPAIWGPDSDGGHRHKPVADPLTVYLTLDQFAESDGQLEYAFNLRDALRDDIDQCQEDGSFNDGLALIRDALRSLADEIDAAIKAAPQEKV